MTHHPSLQPSAWVERFAPLIPAGGEVLDLACGQGRHARLLARLGYRVTAADRDASALDQLAGVHNIETRCLNLEDGCWPFAGRGFYGIVVTNYLYRPHLNDLLAALKPGGVFIYETFMQGHERFGKPGNPDFLLRPGELLEWVRGRLEVVAFEQGEVDKPRPGVTQRLCARRATAAA